MNWTALLWFVAIVASIPLLLWLFKRSQGLGINEIAGTARPVAVLPLSASQKLVTVEVGRGEDKVWLVLGVTPSHITTLHTMVALPPLTQLAPTVPGGIGGSADLGMPRAAHFPTAASGPPSATFAQLLGRLRGSGPGRHAR